MKRPLITYVLGIDINSRLPEQENNQATEIYQNLFFQSYMSVKASNSKPCIWVKNLEGTKLVIKVIGGFRGGAPRSGRTPLSIYSHPPEHIFAPSKLPSLLRFINSNSLKKINNIHHYRMILRCIIFLSIFL